MGRFEEINKVLRAIDSKNPGYLDKLSDNDVNNIQEIKESCKGLRIKNFKVIRDNETIEFDYILIPDI